MAGAQGNSSRRRPEREVMTFLTASYRGPVTHDDISQCFTAADRHYLCARCSRFVGMRPALAVQDAAEYITEPNQETLF